jgi:membrane protein YqaA with SNARE-associated domain
MAWGDIYRLLIGAASPQSVAHDVRHWIAQLGGVGLIPLGVLDASLVPIPGSMDVLTIVLAARDSKLWFYYAGMATLGSVIGALVTFRLAHKGGKETLKRKVSAARAERIIEIFSRWGFWSIAIAALLPPPVPMVPFVIAAGATQYPTQKFLVALTVARAIRYTLLALLAARYGRLIIRFITHPAHPGWYVAFGVAVIAGVIIICVVFSARKKKRVHA